MINALEFKETMESYFDDVENPLSLLPGLNHINILVGENNSGKSRFLRSLINCNQAIILSDIDDNEQKKQFESIKNRLLTCIEKLSEREPRLKVHDRYDHLSPSDLFVYYKKMQTVLELSRVKNDAQYRQSYVSYSSNLDQLYSLIAQKNGVSYRSLQTIQKVYIPVLRGIENFNQYFDNSCDQQLHTIPMNENQRKALEKYKENASSIYKNKVCQVYGMKESQVFTGEDLYTEIRNKLLGVEKERKFVREFEGFISENFYDGKGFTIIPIIKKGCLNVKIADSAEHPIFDLGDGIKQMICILYKAFEYRDSETVFFIEEPEINLHPGFQRRLLEILQKEEFSKLQFLISTHSNHLIDSCFSFDNISIYKFINIGGKNNKFKIVNTTHNDIEVLNLLGVNNSSVFMSNSTIWVEGVSDKIYLSKYLKVFMESEGHTLYREGIDYSFVEYGGNNVTHWSFRDNPEDSNRIRASGITNRAFLVVDNDNNSSRKAKRKEELELVLGDRFYELKVREIENTISKSVLEKTLFSGAPICKTGANKKKDRYDTQKAYLWEYIDSHYELGKKYWNSNKSAPRVSKADFAYRICSNIHSIGDLSESALDLCERIYMFISKVSGEINQ